MPFEIDSAAFTLAKDWLPHLFTLLREQRSARREEIDRIADVFGDPTQLAEFYIEPDCQQFNPADDDEDEVRYIVREPIFNRLKYFFGGHLLTGGHQMFILADSGMGKSSVLMMLKLAHLQSFWPKDYDCVLLKIGPETVDQVNSITGKRKTILLLDALDEDPQAWGRIRSRLGELLTASRNFWRVLISCRTQFFSAGEDPFNRRGKVEVAGFICPVIYLSLFSEEQVNEYLLKRFPKNSIQTTKAKTLLSRMRSLRFRPMLLAHIEDLLHSDTTEWTEYSIYEALVSAWLLREKAKSLPSRRMPEVRDLWNACEALALHLHKTGKREVSQIDLEVFMAGSFRRLNKLDIGGRSLLNKNSEGAFRFSHYSIQEFLVAHAVISGIRVQTANSIRPTDQLITFLFSWLDRQKESVRANAKLGVLNLQGIEFPDANLSRVSLRGANLRNANLMRANFSRANLMSADLSDAILTQTNFTGSDLTDAKLINANVTGARMQTAVLRRANLDKARLDEVDLDHGDLSGSFLGGTRLLNARLRGVNFEGAILRDTKLSGADLTYANLKGLDLKRANLSNCTLHGAHLEGADLSQTQIHKGMLTDAIYDIDTVWPVSFDHKAHGVKRTAKRFLR